MQPDNQQFSYNQNTGQPVPQQGVGPAAPNPAQPQPMIQAMPGQPGPSPMMQPQPMQGNVAPGQVAPNQQPDNKDQPKKNTPNSAQSSLLFSEMRENMMIMHDGSFRAVIQCQSINFDLMSSREREGVEFSYQNFLNSLYFPVQILIRSRRVDIGPYIDMLMNIRRSQDNMLLNVLMDDYINFIDILAQEANIMDKSFFIIVPYYPAGDLNEIKKQAKGLFDSFFGGKKEVAITKINQDDYEKARDEIKNRVDSVMSGLFQMGVKSGQLSTREIAELFYSSYNPDTAARQPIDVVNPKDLAGVYVRKGEGNNPHGGGI